MTPAPPSTDGVPMDAAMGGATALLDREEDAMTVDAFFATEPLRSEFYYSNGRRHPHAASRAAAAKAYADTYPDAKLLFVYVCNLGERPPDVFVVRAGVPALAAAKLCERCHGYGIYFFLRA